MTQYQKLEAIEKLFTKKETDMKLLRKIFSKEELNALRYSYSHYCQTPLIEGFNEFIGGGSFSVIYKGCLNSLCDPKMIIRIVLYNPLYNTYPFNLKPETIEYTIHRKLYISLYRKKCFNITVPIFSFSCETKDSIFLEEYKKDIINHFNKEYFKDRLYVRVTFSNLAYFGDLYSLLKKPNVLALFIEEEIRLINLFFQVFATLTLIYQDYPTYRHNDLHFGNILIDRLDSSIQELTYKIGDETYKIQSCGMIALLNDFDSSSIHPEYPNVRDFLKKFGTYYTEYFDVCKFINDFNSSFIHKTDYFSKEFRDFCYEVVPLELVKYIERIKNTNITRYRENIGPDFLYIKASEIGFNYKKYTPSRLIKHKIFNKLKNKYNLRPSSDYKRHDKTIHHILSV
jgi:hypothetical protein